MKARVWCDGIRDEEEWVAGGGEKAKLLEDDRDEASIGDEAKDGVVGGTKVAVARLAIRPVEEVEVEEERMEGGAMAGWGRWRRVWSIKGLERGDRI